jgi:hypothetical protein
MGEIADQIFDEALDDQFMRITMVSSLWDYGCMADPIHLVQDDEGLYTCSGTCEKCERDGKHMMDI